MKQESVASSVSNQEEGFNTGENEEKETLNEAQKSFSKPSKPFKPVIRPDKRVKGKSTIVTEGKLVVQTYDMHKK